MQFALRAGLALAHACSPVTCLVCPRTPVTVTTHNSSLSSATREPLLISSLPTKRITTFPSLRSNASSQQQQQQQQYKFPKTPPRFHTFTSNPSSPKPTKPSIMATATVCNSTPSFNISSPPLRTPSSTSSIGTCCLIQSHPSKRLVLFRSEHLKRRFWGADRVRRFEISCKATVITEKEFSETVLGSDLPVLVEFVANWCGPCRLIAPVVDWASQEYKDRLKVVKIDHDSNPRLIEEYKVYGLPTLILFKNGQEVPDSHREGAMTKVKLKEYLDTLLETVTAT